MESRLIYFNWNVMKKIKNLSQNKVHDELELLSKVNSLRNKYYYVFSTAHLSDLMKGYCDKTKDLVFDDLNFLDSFTKNEFGLNYLCFEFSQNQPRIFNVNPQYAFEKEYDNSQNIEGIYAPELFDSFFNNYEFYKKNRNRSKFIAKKIEHREIFFYYINEINDLEELKKIFLIF